MTTRGGTVEVEVKFDVLERRAARSIMVAPDLGGILPLGVAERRQIVDQYVDTPDGRLRTRGWTARLRTDGAVTRLQLKALGVPDASGVSRREEIEGPADSATMPAAWPTSAARRRLLQIVGAEPLSPWLVLRQDRLARRFGDAGSSMEVSLDRVEVVIADRPIAKRVVIEVEQQAAPESAFRLVIAHLAAQPHLAVATSTKLAWGAQIMGRGVDADGLPVFEVSGASFRATDPTSEVGRTIMAGQLRTMIDREGVVSQVAGPEEIRRLRVATRRLRATWRAFERAYAGTRPDRLRRGLRQFARLLNDVRNLDVMDRHLEAHLEQVDAADQASIEALRLVWSDQRVAALARLLTESSSAGHRQLVGSFVDFVQSPAADVRPIAPPGPRRLADELGGWIWSAFEGLIRWQPLLETAGMEELHELRLETKRLRDLLQVVAPVTGPTTRAVAESLAALQDALGAMNDAVVTAAAVRHYLVNAATSLTPEAIAAIERFATDQDGRALAARTRVPAAWRVVTDADARKRIARLIGGL